MKELQKREKKKFTFLNETFIKTKWQKELKRNRRAKHVSYEGKIQIMCYTKKRPSSPNGKKGAGHRTKNLKV